MDNKLKHALAMMWFAYVNKDEDCPHDFEIEALQEAEKLLGKWEDCISIWLNNKNSDLWKNN